MYSFIYLYKLYKNDFCSGILDSFSVEYHCPRQCPIFDQMSHALAVIVYTTCHRIGAYDADLNNNSILSILFLAV